MKDTSYRQIFWGIILVAIVFAAPFVIPRAAKLLGKISLVHAQSSGVTLTGVFDPPNGPSGTVVTIYGTGFTSTNNTVHFGTVDIPNNTSGDGTSLVFEVPSTFPNSQTTLPGGDYPVSVSNANGQSNAYTFTLICNSSDCESGGGIDPKDIHLCSGHFNCIEGFKVPLGSVADQQTVSVDGTSTIEKSFSFDGFSTGLHTISVTVPANWYSGFTACVNNIRCHGDIPIQGDSLTVNFLPTSNSNPSVSNGVLNVPDGSYVDLYWHFSQNFGDFGSGGLGPPGTTTATTTISTSTPPFSTLGPQQAAAYTGGNTNGGSGFSPDAIGQGLADAAQNVLGCSVSQILNPTIRSVIARDQSVFQNPSPKRGGSFGGASIIVNASGDTSGINVTQLPYISGNTTQSAIDTRVTRAAQVGIGNNPAWDAVAYCLQNAMVNYINKSAMNWLNTAFNGNPAFVQNLTTFLTGISDQQARAFFTQLRGVNPNSPIQPWVYQNLVNGYNTSYSQLSRYTLNQYSSNPRAFVNGDWSQGGWSAQSHLYDPANFSYSALWLAQDELGSRVAAAQYDANQNLNWGQGVFPTRECNNQTNTVIPGIDCKTTTPASVNREVNVNRLLLSENRGSIATGFNQAIQGLLQELPIGDIFKGAQSAGQNAGQI